MANQETAFGLRPIGLVGSGTNSTGLTTYEIASDNTNAIYNGAICVPLAAGVIDQAGATSGGTTQALGVMMGCEYVDSVTKKTTFLNHWPGSNSVSVDTNHPVKALVADNPNQLFKVASDASLTNRATALAAVLRTLLSEPRLVPAQMTPVGQIVRSALARLLRRQPFRFVLLASWMMKLTVTLLRQVSR